MKKFKRPNVTEEQKLYDRFVNSFYEGDFIVDKVFDNLDRDIKDPFFKMLSNTYSMGIYNSILVGYKKVPYNEEIIQDIELKVVATPENKKISNSTFGLTHPMNVQIYKCIWMRTPVSHGKIDEGYAKNKKSTGVYKLVQPKKAKEIMNTLKRINELKHEYYIVPEVVEFLKNQLDKQDLTGVDKMTNEDDLFFKDLKNNTIHESYILVPLMINNRYYDDGAGNKRYPYITEKFHYHKTRADQIKFHVKEVKKTGCVLVDSYFTTGRPKKEDNEIFVIKQYGTNFYNPFMFLEYKVAERLYKRIRNNPIVSLETVELLDHTFKHYVDNYDLKIKFGNAIPTVDIISSSVKSLRLKKQDDLLTRLVEETNDDCDIDLEEDFDGEYTIEDPEEEARAEAVRKSKGFSTIDDKTIESVILGHNGLRCFGYYDHITEYFLRVFISSGANIKKNNKSINLETQDIPRPLQLLATINQNTDMFMTNTITNPLDVFGSIAYKKYLYYTPKVNSKATEYVNPKERYRSDDEYGIIDPITVKSEETCGLVANIIPYSENDSLYIYEKNGEE